MVQATESKHTLEDGSIELDSWLGSYSDQHPDAQVHLVKNACFLAKLSGEDQTSFSGSSCLQQGLTMADILLSLNQDAECIAAAILYDSTQHAELSLDIVREQLGPNVAKLINGVRKMEAAHTIAHDSLARGKTENLRMMLLAMVKDVRVVLIKLAEQICLLRAASTLSSKEQQVIAQECREVYAPLANRLGISPIKWELEDRSFRFLQPDIYKKIAKLLDERRIDRERYVDEIKQTLIDQLKSLRIEHTEVQGRVKHIYSIYKKMQKKNLSYDQLYDITAVRIMVNTVEECYQALDLVHRLWEQIPEEFDDYIADPKPNGYQSIHTAVIGPNNKNIEVQIRTFEMHQENEEGVAAHWVYKEGKQKPSVEARIAWLRQVLDWQHEVTGQEDELETEQNQMLSDRVYVFTPAGDVVDLPRGATPLDFAYHIHTEVGHRCKGAKINDKIVPLTYTLQLGDRVDILTSKKPNPSRDWVNSHLGYLQTSRAKAKVFHWFKQQNYDENLAAGQHMLEQECKRLGISIEDMQAIADRYNYKKGDDIYAAIGCGDLSVHQVINSAQQALRQQQPVKIPPTAPVSKPQTHHKHKDDIHIEGVGNLLTHIAKCCTPLPGEPIIGYITQGRGISIHRQDCSNISHANEEQQKRLLEVSWGEAATQTYPTTVRLLAYDRQGLLRDITQFFSNEKINLLALNSNIDKSENMASMQITFEVGDLQDLSRVMDKLKQLPNVYQVERES